MMVHQMQGAQFMSIEVRIPIHPRLHTGGKQLPSELVMTLRELVVDLESRHTGLAGRLIDGDVASGLLRRFINIYVNDEDVRFTGIFETPASLTATRSRCRLRWRGLSDALPDNLLDWCRHTPAGWAAEAAHVLCAFQ
jgi:hypothetical protein